MREAPFLDGNKLKRLVKFFTGFLAVLLGLLTVHYPVLPEKILPLFSVDHLEAVSLGEFLSALAFAASLVAVVLTWRSDLNHAGQADAIGAKRLLGLGLVFLLAAGFGCLIHFALVRVSARVARAISVAQEREITDRFARDVLVELRAPSIGFMEAHRIATEFLEAERLPGISVDEVLQSAKDAPFEGSVIATYAATMLCFKLGLFFAAAGLALLSSPNNLHKKNRRLNLGDVRNLSKELTN
jgi:hypothetical protein